MEIDELAKLLSPARTTLIFGAGASIPSGAPSGHQLALKLGRLLTPEPDGAELSEVAQLVENRKSRRILIEAVQDALQGLAPTAGLLTLPDFDWLSIYTTNFDTLVEQSYRQNGRQLDVYRSNYDVAAPRGERTPLYKIHGCVTQDSAFGHKSRMLITESDYDDYEQYRQTLFNALQQDMFTSDTVIIGQSLADRHLKDLAKKVVTLRSQGISTRIFLLVHEFHPDRVELYSRLGIEVIHADLDRFLLAMLNSGKTTESPTYSTSTDNSLLTSGLVLTTIDVGHAGALPANATRLFNGAPATYGDIRHGLTIPRVAESRLEDSLTGARGFFTVVEGARGVGKTTLARAFLLRLSDRNISAWEHQSDSNLDVEAWLGVESRLRLSNRDGVLLIDDCSRHMREINQLVDKLAALDRPHLRIVLTADAAKWKISRKSAGFFSRGTHTRLSVLERGDLEELVGLVERRPEIKALVEQSFLALGRTERLSRLTNKCSSEMFVCLKNIFGNDNLDDILLQEYFSLSTESQDVYRYVAAVQSLGGFVHRQLVMRILGLGATSLDSILAHLEGIVFERVVDARHGIFGWETRHDVIASIIAKLKFADQVELERLLIDLIDGLNPSVRIEMETAIALATEENGIIRLTSFDAQVAMYRRLIGVIPGHRTPRRRLTKLFLSRDLLPEASQEIVAFERAIGSDMVMQRYKAQIGLRKAETILLIEESDRKAMLQDAESIIRQCITRYGPDVHTYYALGQIGLALAARFGDYTAVDAAIDFLTEYESVNGDPQIQTMRRRLSDQLRHLENGDTESFSAAATIDLDPVIGID